VIPASTRSARSAFPLCQRLALDILEGRHHAAYVVRSVWRGGGCKDFLIAFKSEWMCDAVPDVAAALTFFGVLPLFPFLIFLVARASTWIDPNDVEVLIRELNAVAPGAAADVLADRLRALARGHSPALLGLSGLGAIWAASGGVSALIRALNRI